MPVEEHHEVRELRVSVDAPRPDLAHEVHAHHIAAEAEEGRVAEGEDAEVSPDEVKGDRKKRVAEILAEQGYGVRADIEGAAVLEEGIARNQQKHEYPYRAKNAEPAPVLFQ